jgi:EAL domain-containing protein (putative c-di-GMP-specific phosphodiesterase class I)/GGDEF domain-containing protein
MRAVPRAFAVYLLPVVAAATFVAARAAEAAGFQLPHEPVLWILALLVLGGELLPIHVPRRAGNDWLTISSPFGLAVLLAFGLWPAIVVYALASAIGDAVFRTRPAVLVFNVAQYVLALAAAAGVLALLGHPTGPLVLAGAAAFFVVNELLAGTASALLAGAPVTAYLRRDIGFQLWTGGFQLALAPLVVAAADADVWLVALAFCPQVAVWVGGRHAALSAHRAVHDRRTDLPNRSALRDRIGDAGHPSLLLAVAFGELETVRRTLGSEVADQLLAAAAGRVRAALPACDLVGHLEHDQLGVIRPGAGTGAAGDVAATVLSALDEPFEIDGLALEAHALIGASAGRPDEADAILNRAALALGAAREGGRRWAAYEPEHYDHGRERLLLATQLRRGLRRGELAVEYQLKLPLEPGRVCGVEALARWDHPQLGRVAPDGFIPLAESCGLISPLTDAVLGRALADAAGWLARGLDFHLAVNLSTALLVDPSLPHRLGEMLAGAGVPPSRLLLEITESRLLADDARADEVLAQLRALGVGLAIDDFGVGYSSLAQLRRLPVDELKIDKSFVLAMEEDPGAAAVVRAAADLGRDLSLDVVAEGVETPAVARRVRELGCQYAQGYLFGRPVPAAECEARLRGVAAVPVAAERPRLAVAR